MSDYGQSIPTKFVWNTSTLLLTRASYASYVARAMANCGMQFIPSMSSYDILDPSNAEFAGAVNTQVYFFFDFPTTETFSIGGVNYRPLIGFMYGFRLNNTDQTDRVHMEDHFSFKMFIRRADRVNITDLYTYSNDRFPALSPANYGWGSTTVSTNGGIAGEDGMDSYDQLWLPHATFGGSYNLKNVGNVFVYLGPGGLVIQIGVGQHKTDFGSIHNMAFPFGMGRIAGRGRIPIQDVNLNRICPVFPLPLRSVDSEFYNSAAANGFNGLVQPEVFAWALGAQFNLQFALKPIQLHLYNLENIQQPLYPGYSISTFRSPRLVNGVARHVLNQPAIVPWNKRGTASELYDFVDTQIDGSQPRPQWNDVFTTQNFRFGDHTMPNGRFEDPITLTDWFTFYAPNTNTMYAVNIEGGTDVAANSPPALSLSATSAYDVASAGFASTFPTTVTVTNAAAQVWTTTAATDEIVHTNTTVAATFDMTWLIDTNPADSNKTQYRLIFNARCRRTGGTTDNVNALQMLMVDYNGATNTLLSLSSTTNTLAPEWNYQAFEFIFTPELTTGRFHLIFRKNCASANAAMTAIVTGLSIRKYTR